MKKIFAVWSVFFVLASLSSPVRAEGDSPDEGAVTEKKVDKVNTPGGGALVEKEAENVKPAKKTTKSKKKDAKAAEAKAKGEKGKGKAKDKEEAKGKVETREDGLVIEDLVTGSGMEAKLGSKITVHYRGTFMNGKEFDSSYKGGKPITFGLEEGRLIKGWTDGIPGMKVGGKRKLHVPWKSAYGEDGTPNGEIPPKADLNFEVELIKVE